MYVHCRITYNLFVRPLETQLKKRAYGELFAPVWQRVQMHFISSENIRLLCLSCIGKKAKKKNNCQTV